MTPEQLKASILQYAIQGKLVEQIPEEGTGEELYQQIQAEKQQLIKEGKIKKEKALPEIAEDEIPFDLPDSWRWVRLSQLVSVLNGDRGKNYPAKSTLSHKGIPFISALNLDGKSVIEDDNLLCLSEQQYERLGNGKLIRDDIVVCIRGSLGKHGRYPFDKGAIASSLVILRPFMNEAVMAEFLMMYLDTPLFFSEIRRYDNGTAQPNLAAKSLEQFLLPLPPLAEQQRIITKIEELLPHVDRYAAAYEKLEQFNAKFPNDMKKSILEYAIQGKLVEQRAEEGTGEELYRQIQAEKQQLIKEGKIKKEKPLPEIAEDEIPFEIPESWKWVRLPEVGTSSLGKTLNKGLDAGNEVPYLCSINVYWDGINLDQIKTAKFSEADTEKYLLRKGDLLICEGGDVGRSAVWDRDMEMYYQNALHCVRFFGAINPYYFKYCLELYKYNRILENASKGMTIKHLVQGALYSIPFPLPPLDEQKRIVAKLEEILPLCERLK